MKIHEYQAKELLASYEGIAVPKNLVVATPDDAAAAFDRLGLPLAVVKAQIHAGGRGKGGGVKLVKSAQEAREAAQAILAKPLITHQTGPAGQPVKKLLVEAGTDIAKEYYVGIALDRETQLPMMMASSEGGVEIEEVAAATPEKIIKEPLDLAVGIHQYQARRLAKAIGLPTRLWDTAVRFFHGLARAYLENGATLAEINPLVMTGGDSSTLMALDAKMVFDENGLARYPRVAELRDVDEEDAVEREADAAGLSYVNLDGNIGCLVNGAGLAMGTMDIIKHAGGEPSNFLDVGGGANKDQVKTAFELILRDPDVKGILVNIFGGILRCTTLAEGIVAAVREVKLHVPLVVRLEGTEVEEGRRILAESGLPIITATDMADAAKKVVEAASKA